MSTNAADDFEAIRRRLEELAAEKQVALTGSSAPVQAEEPISVETIYGIDCSGWRQLPGFNWINQS